MMLRSEHTSAVAALAEPFTNAGADKQKVAILDCGAQYTKVIDRRIRELAVETQLFPVDVAAHELAGYGAIILSGGPHSVYEAQAPQCDNGLWSLGIPVLGICYGMQLMTQQLGGCVAPHGTREYGETRILVNRDAFIFQSLEPLQTVLMSHGDSVTQLPEGFEVIARSEGASKPNEADNLVGIAAIADPVRRFYGLQFHPEVELTAQGQAMLAHFLFQVAGLSASFTLVDRLQDAIEQIQEQAGNKPVFVLVSGGVDSSVTAALLLKALGPDRVYAVHIDSGLMRQDESSTVMTALKALGLKHFKLVPAEGAFLNGQTTLANGQRIGPLSQTIHPEHKRQIIGDVFFRLIQDEIRAVAEEIGVSSVDEVLIAQGTLRPDLIESGNLGISSSAHTIKTHHNDVDIVREHRKKGLILEPNKDWHKDEVRQVGRQLGLPEALVSRQPFPGPGLGVRILCSDGSCFDAEHYETHNRALKALVSKLTKKDFSDNQIQATLAPVQSVGVQGDGRSYSHLALLWAKTPELHNGAQFWDVVYRLASDIPNQLPAVNRLAVVLNADQYPVPDSLEQSIATTLTPEVISIARQADEAAMAILQQAGLFVHLSQALTVLVPIGTSVKPSHHSLAAQLPCRSAAIRAVVTTDFMTARAARVGSQALPLKV
ncbi:MAG: glutamine-hydrolyzing GMP synthase, partial [Vampirovibrionales bacterium]|nr:glutamine-hydrolyzing GMP synthase [Vampirovibrionales bacterium]